MSRLIALVLGVALLVGTATAHEYAAGPIRIGHPWARETAPNQTVGGGYLTIVNSGSSADLLLSASSNVATEVQIHSMSMDGGIMRMRQLTNGLAIPAGATVKLEPGGLHIMFMGLKTPLKKGAMIPVTLRFRDAGKVSVGFAIDAVGTEMPMNMPHRH